MYTLIALLALSASTPDITLPQEAEGYAPLEKPRYEDKYEAPNLPPSIELHTTIISPKFSLKPLTKKEKNRLIRKGKEIESLTGVAQVAQLREEYITEEFGAWTPLEDGSWIWSVEIYAPESTFLRTRTAGMDLEKDCSIVFYDPFAPSSSFSKFENLGPLHNGVVHSAASFSGTLRVEFYTPKLLNQLPFILDQITYGYIDLFSSINSEDRGAGSCHNQPICYNDVIDERRSVALIQTGGGVCSGQLIATVTNDETPYYSTANHCLSTEAEANASLLFFRYEPTSCGSSPANPFQLAGGLDLVDTYPNSDNTLLLARYELPEFSTWQPFFMGWTVSSIPNGTDSVCLHHPAGDYMRISYGDRVSFGVCGSSSFYYGVTWNDGVTEPGSSGSAIMRDSDNKLYGVLTCGASSCSNTSGADGYGNFARAYNNGGFSQFLIAGDDDDSLDNDTCQTAQQIENGTTLNNIVKSTDDDWLHIPLSNGGNAVVVIGFTDIYGDIDLRMYEGCNGTQVASSTTNTNGEYINFTNNTGQTKDYYVQIYMDSGQRNLYSLTVNADEVVKNPCIADCTGDGNVNTADLLEIVSDFGNTTGCDQNNDQLINIFDLLDLISNFGTCP